MDVIACPATSDSLLGQQVAAVVGRWRTSGEFSEATLAKTEDTVRRFTQRLIAQGVADITEVTEEHCRGFVDALSADARPPEVTTQHARRVALRMLFRGLREAGVPVHDPTLDLRLPPRSSRSARPLSDAEITLGRAATRLGVAGSATLQRAVAWALAEATAVTSEITMIRISHLDDPVQPRYVELPGTRRVDARVGELTDWGARVVARQVQFLRDRGQPTTALLTYRGTAHPGDHVAQSTACNAIALVLSAAGLGQEPDVRPASVRNWAGRHWYDAGMPVERVARRLGARSLDAAAADIALEWRSSG